MFLRVAEWSFSVRRRKPAPPTPGGNGRDSVLLVELTRLGDVLTALPAVNAIRRAYPQADVHWIVRETYVGFLRLVNPGITIHGISESSSLLAIIQALRISRQTPWSLTCSLGPGRLNGIVALLSGANAVAGFLECSGSKTPFLRANAVSALGLGSPRHVMYAKEPLAGRSLKVCEVLGIPMTPGVESFASQNMRSLVLPQRESDAERNAVIVLHPFAGWKFRMWGAERWVAVARRLTENSRRTVVVLGQAREAAGLEAYREMASAVAGVTIVEVRDLMEAARVIAGADLFIGCDSGPLHLATFLGVQSIGLYGPAEPSLTRPTGSPAVLFHGLYHRVDCSPCQQRHCIRPHDSCMTLIGVDEVVNVAQSILGSIHETMASSHD